MVRPSDAPSEPRLPGGGFLFNVNLVFISTVAAYGLGFVTAVLMARALGDEGLGVTALYRNAVTLGFAFLSLGGLLRRLRRKSRSRSADHTHHENHRPG